MLASVNRLNDDIVPKNAEQEGIRKARQHRATGFVVHPWKRQWVARNARHNLVDGKAEFLAKPGALGFVPTTDFQFLRGRLRP